VIKIIKTNIINLEWRISDNVAFIAGVLSSAKPADY
jgi:hypothetical protein